MTEENNTYKLILKKGLLTYKYKNSKGCPPNFVEAPGKKGVTFAFRNKQSMTKARGFVITSEEAIYENKEKLSHWTPNVYRWGGYTDSNRKHVMGFSEENLQQINTFVIDFDCSKEKVSSDDILIAGLELNTVPTLILETPNGYQAYFVLDQPSYISKANEYKSLRTNKAIARSLKVAFSKEIEGVDFGCNPFGIFRFPREDNIVYYDPTNVFSFKTLMVWSMKISDDQKQERQMLQKNNFRNTEFKQIKTSWFRSLLNVKTIKGGKGLLGRNSAIFTASLACYSSKMEKEDCIDLMDEFNTFLANPLSDREVKKIVRSAYSGRYSGASAQYVQLLEEQWGITQNRSESLNKAAWHKFAKPREEREKTHYSEYRLDLIQLIEQKTKNKEAFIELTRKELEKELNIPESSLKDLLRMLKEDHYVIIQTKPGRGGYTRLGTTKSVVVSLLGQKKEQYAKQKRELVKRLPKAEQIVKEVEDMQLKKEEWRPNIPLEIINTS
ncbi:primase C-terminal domain-containing protein [Marinilactibacillus sp. Marseille-P9653]|uniref:primase C-terminal domain-containing protein n=1 Tax=Marinilactibacillus sp. Marseille-P9653 TaxID=2866583 RepID=UPI001CE3EA4A|nr:primase C-terminal domain-containing protein [Marinilactibacillus sp. Marseille-P9653]